MKKFFVSVSACMNDIDCAYAQEQHFERSYNIDKFLLMFLWNNSELILGLSGNAQLKVGCHILAVGK
jgi:hypothetical protein